jgi:hypothetical protein
MAHVRRYDDLEESKRAVETKCSLLFNKKKGISQEKRQKKEQKDEAEQHLRMQAELVGGVCPGWCCWGACWAAGAGVGMLGP